MVSTLVGYTGFVGGNLLRSHSFDRLYNSRNIGEAFGQHHDLVVYCGVRAEKFLANSDPAADHAVIETAKDNIRRMAPRTLVLISTSDVYKDPNGVDENTPIETEGLHPYGLNRYELECWARENIPNTLVVRLPGLYGAGLKKNFIYDMITLVPSMLTETKYIELSAKSELVKNGYTPAGNGFYKLNTAGDELAKLREYFANADFNSLKFTDSRAIYQFYGLNNLWSDINKALSSGLSLINLTAQPVSAAEVYRYVRGGEFKNELAKPPVNYNIRSIHAALYGGSDGYMYTKEHSLEAIKRGVLDGEFVNL